MKTTTHESYHSSQFTNVGISYWTAFVDKIISNTLILGNDHSYGYGTEPNAGYIGVGEIWGNYFGARCMNQRFGDNGGFQDGYSWFHPGFIMDMHNTGGLSDQQLFGCFSSTINSISKLRDELLWRFPGQTALINGRYHYYYE